MSAEVVQLTMPGMGGPGRRRTTSSEFKEAVMQRTREARESVGLSLVEIAKLLQQRVGRPISADSYRKWEQESLSPHDVIVAFCDVTHTHPFKLLEHDAFVAGTVTVLHAVPRRPELPKGNRRHDD